MAADEAPKKKFRPFARLRTGLGKLFRKKHTKDLEQNAAEGTAEENHEDLNASGKSNNSFKNRGLRVWRNFKARIGRGEVEDSESSDEDDDHVKDKDYFDVSDGDVSEVWDGEDEDDLEEVDAFRPGEYNHPGYVYDPIERLGPEDLADLD